MSSDAVLNLSLADFHLKIIIVGYSSLGESVIILFMENEIVLDAMVIDSFEQLDESRAMNNKTISILERYNVERVSAFFWTHPHRDHSKGLLKLMKKYSDSKTVHVYPVHVSTNDGDIISLNKGEKDTLKGILKYNKKKHRSALPVSVMEGECRLVRKLVLTDDFSRSQYNARVCVLSPNCSELENYADGNKCNANEVSLSILVDINDYSFFFGGDVQDKHIQAMNKNVLNGCRFVKIPHHGSSTSSSLIGFLPSRDLFDNACSTIYRNHNLPEDNVMAQYKLITQNLISTGDIKRPRVPCSYGIISYDYIFADDVISYSINLEGDCKEY